MRGLFFAAYLALAPSVAIADTHPSEAISASKQAEALARAGRYVDAAKKFAEAFELDPRPEYLCNVGVAYQRAKILPKAQVYLAECLRRGGNFDSTFVAAIRKGLEAVEASLRDADFTPIDVVVEPRGALVRIDDDPLDEALVGSRLVYVPFGHHTIAVSATGYQEQRRELDAVTRSQRALRVELTPAPAPAAKPAEVPVRHAVQRSRVPAMIATLVTIGAGAAGAASYWRARSIMDDASSTTIDRPTYDDIVERSRGWQHVSWALGGGAAVGAVLSIWLWSRTGTHVEVTPTRGGGAVAWGLSW